MQLAVDTPIPGRTHLCPTCFTVLTGLGMARNPLSVGCCKDITVTHALIAATRLGMPVSYLVD
jgi:hypothetical protein